MEKQKRTRTQRKVLPYINYKYLKKETYTLSAAARMFGISANTLLECLPKEVLRDIVKVDDNSNVRFFLQEDLIKVHHFLYCMYSKQLKERKEKDIELRKRAFGYGSKEGNNVIDPF